MAEFLRAEKLTAGYGEQRIIKEVSFSVGRGEWVGVIGPNGAGKTTLLKSLSGVLSAFAGGVSFQGRRLTEWPVRELARQLAMVSQEEEMLFPFTVKEVVLMGRSPYLSRFGWEGAKDRTVAERCMEQTDVRRYADRPFNQLSSGERRRVLVARALAQEPRLLLLDEPTAYLDLKHQLELFYLLRELHHKKGLTIFMTLHDLNFAGEFCKRLILFNKGKIFKQGAPKRVLTSQNLRQVYGVQAVVRSNPASKAPWVFPTGLVR